MTDIIDRLRGLASGIDATEGSGTAGADACRQAVAEIERLRKVCRASGGYLMNALCDLSGNTPKRTAIMTVEGGLKMLRDAGVIE